MHKVSTASIECEGSLSLRHCGSAISECFENHVLLSVFTEVCRMVVEGRLICVAAERVCGD